MDKIKKLTAKTWVFIAATLIIIGSASAMVYALNNNIPDSMSANVTPSSMVSKENSQNQVSPAAKTPEYTVIDLSKTGPDSERTQLVMDKLKRIEGITPAQLQERYQAVIASMTPGEKDISAEQAAAYGAAILKKGFGVDLTGYTAEASFSRNPVPNSDNWGVIFHAPNEVNSSKRYSVSVDSVKGSMLDASCFDLDFSDEMQNKTANINLRDPAWKDKAVQNVSKFMASGVSITGSRVLPYPKGTGEAAVWVVCTLSDGSAYAVSLIGENKEATGFQYFPNGYDGSLDYRLVTKDGVG